MITFLFQTLRREHKGEMLCNAENDVKLEIGNLYFIPSHIFTVSLGLGLG
jgi:hypothetical protein